MLTPQEVSEHAFAKASFGGYNMAMVDEFLDVLTADYTTLYKENATLKAKMKVLVDKLEEYRSTEEAMRKALLTAQRIADDMVAEAESKKAELLRDAETSAKTRMSCGRRSPMRRRALPPPAAPQPPMWPSFRDSISTSWTISTACLPLWLPPPRAPTP